ncbi:hypothetical protein [Candidatus Leptofilum sp.]|uniref:hypothetical protein n=1 Tax=Candidatus Leptofilum sp. TaxID=3241576 RepID=UPI003B5AE102
MIRLYFDTCILNDFFALIQYEYGEGMRAKDVKAPLSRWTPEYIALYYLLNLDDQWQLIFGTSETTLNEIKNFSPIGHIAHEKRAFLERAYCELSKNWESSSEPVSDAIVARVNSLFGPGYDSTHICRAIQNRWDFFLTTDFKTILNNLVAVREIENKIKIRSPLQFLEENLLPLSTLIRTLHGSWTDIDTFITTFSFDLNQLRN